MNQNPEKKGILAELLKVADKNGELPGIDFEFLIRLASNLGLSKIELLSLIEEYIQFFPPKFEAERIVHFHRLVIVMKVDENSTDEEIQYVKDAGIKMGLNPLATNEILKIMNDFPLRNVPNEKLIEIFTLYHN